MQLDLKVQNILNENKIYILRIATIALKE